MELEGAEPLHDDAGRQLSRQVQARGGVKEVPVWIRWASGNLHAFTCVRYRESCCRAPPLATLHHSLALAWMLLLKVANVIALHCTPCSDHLGLWALIERS
jgi:hypothetical protein